MKIKITPDAYFIISLGMSILFHSIFPIVKIIAYPYSLVGIGLILAGILLVFVTNSILLQHKTSMKPFKSPSALITFGPFKFSRNPIYLGMTIALVGVAVILGSLSPFMFPLLFAMMMNNSHIPIEERSLEKLFGKEYLNYKSKVKRWI